MSELKNCHCGAKGRIIDRFLPGTRTVLEVIIRCSKVRKHPHVSSIYQADAINRWNAAQLQFTRRSDPNA